MPISVATVMAVPVVPAVVPVTTAAADPNAADTE
jgi:hypothetical protein